MNGNSGRTALRDSCFNALDWPLQRRQRDPPLAIVDQCPLGRTLIAQPVVFHLPLRLPRADKRRDRGRPRLRQTIRFHQEQLAFPQPEKWFVALGIGTVAEHDVTAFRSREETSENSQIRIWCTSCATASWGRTNAFLSVRALPT